MCGSAPRVRLTAGEQQQLARRETVNPQAYELLMKGRFFQQKGDSESGRKGLACFEEAIAIDPNYALAHAELSRTLSARVTNNLLDPKEGTPRAEAEAQRALELDEGLAEAHLVMAAVKMNHWDWLTAEREYKRALELRPNFSGAHIGYTFFLIIHRRDAEALAQARRARELDPLSTMANAVVVYGLMLNDQFDEALDRVNQMLELEGSNPFIHTVLGQVYSAKGQHQQAAAAFQEAIKLGDDSPDAQVALGQAFARAGQPEKARAMLQRLEKGKEYVSHTNMALLYASVGDFEQAFSHLELGYQARDQDLIWLRVTPMVNQSNSDPRLENLLKRIGLK
jgi:Tfp pilus assembly protein PilF